MRTFRGNPHFYSYRIPTHTIVPLGATLGATKEQQPQLPVIHIASIKHSSKNSSIQPVRSHSASTMSTMLPHVSSSEKPYESPTQSTEQSLEQFKVCLPNRQTNYDFEQLGIYLFQCANRPPNVFKVGFSTSFPRRFHELCTHDMPDLCQFRICVYMHFEIAKDELTSKDCEDIHQAFFDLEQSILNETKYCRAEGMRAEWRNANVEEFIQYIITHIQAWNVYNDVFRLMYRLNYRPPCPQVASSVESVSSTSVSSKSILPTKSVSSMLIRPRPHQEECLQHMRDHFTTFSNGHIVQACGVGKALLAILYLSYLKTCRQQPSLFVIGVPSVQLVLQMVDEIRKVFLDDCPILCVCSRKIHRCDGNVTTTTDSQFIRNWNVQHHQATRLIVTTYASSNKVVLARVIAYCRIGDECHHLRGTYTISQEDNTHLEQNRPQQTWQAFWEIPATQSLFLTATPVYAEDDADIHARKGTMSDETRFGERLVLCDRSVRWAIEHRCIVDYSICVMDHDADEVEEMIATLYPNRRRDDDDFIHLFLSALVTLKALVFYREQGRCTHNLIYTNTIEDANLVDECINDIITHSLLERIPADIFHKALHSQSEGTLQEDLDAFKAAAYGIVPCAYLLSEGFDMAELDAVTIASPMHAHIRIVQSVLRPNRVNPSKPNKHATVLLPTIDIDEWEPGDRQDKHANIKLLLDALHEEDDACDSKVVVYHSDIPPIVPTINIPVARPHTEYLPLFVDNESSLDRLRIKMIRGGTLKAHEKNKKIYTTMRKLNQRANIRSIREYNNLQNTQSSVHIEDPSAFFKQGGKNIWKGWTHFLGYNISKLPDSLDAWKDICKANGIDTAQQYTRFVEQQSHQTPAVLPHDPEDYSAVVPSFEFSGLSGELDKLCESRRRRRR